MQLSHPIYHLKHRAKLISRAEGIPLHAALDRVAKEQGFRSWGLLTAHPTSRGVPKAIYRNLSRCDLMLLAGRPGQGKTRLSLELAIQALRRGGHAVFFTLEYTEAQTRHVIRDIGSDPGEFENRMRIDTSDEISATYIERELAAAEPGTLVVVDYLQVLDQKRENAPLADQIASLRAVALERELIIICLSQVDRAFEESGRRLPAVTDVRLPNPADLSLFSKLCFVHENRVEFAPSDR